MLARRLPGILPPPTLDEALEITRDPQRRRRSADGGLADRAAVPRAAPHDLARRGWSAAARTPRPGEITLAHRGVLFLDELAEFSRPALEALRQPLEDGSVDDHARAALGRASRRASMLVAASQPVPVRVGRASDCECTRAGDASATARRLSGPLLDRIDLVCQRRAAAGARARRGRRGRRERRRRSARGSSRRASASATRLGRHAGALQRRDGRAARPARLVPLGEPARRARSLAARRRRAVSGRGHDRVLRVARTIADLERQAKVERDRRRRGARLPRGRRRTDGGGVSGACDALPAPRLPARAARRRGSRGLLGRPRRAARELLALRRRLAGSRPAAQRRAGGAARSRALRAAPRCARDCARAGVRGGLPAPRRRYPAALADLRDAPAVLFCRGSGRAASAR